MRCGSFPLMRTRRQIGFRGIGAPGAPRGSVRRYGLGGASCRRPRNPNPRSMLLPIGTELPRRQARRRATSPSRFRLTDGRSSARVYAARVGEAGAPPGVRPVDQCVQPPYAGPVSVSRGRGESTIASVSCSSAPWTTSAGHRWRGGQWAASHMGSSRPPITWAQTSDRRMRPSSPSDRTPVLPGTTSRRTVNRSSWLASRNPSTPSAKSDA